jgi:hypothetical protein
MRIFSEPSAKSDLMKMGYRLFTFIALFALAGCAAMILWW